MTLPLPLRDPLYEAFLASGLGRYGWKYEQALRSPPVRKCLGNLARAMTRTP